MGEAAARLRRLVYSSRAVTRLDDAALLALLDGARQNNARLEITGVLLYADGDFLQVLEGPPVAVASLFAVIDEDPRHDGCRILSDESDESADARIFADWSMGFQSLAREDLLQLPGFSDYFNADVTPGALLRPAEGSSWRTAAQFLMLGFRSLKIDRPRS